MTLGGRSTSRAASPPIGDLPADLGRPATRALAAAGIRTLDDVARHTEAELVALHGVGPRAIGVLVAALGARGLAMHRREEPGPTA